MSTGDEMRKRDVAQNLQVRGEVIYFFAADQIIQSFTKKFINYRKKITLNIA